MLFGKPTPPPVALADYIATIMCPDRKRPGLVADKVGVEAGNGKVVHAFIGAGVVQLSDRHPPTIVADQQVAGSQLARRHPTMLSFSTQQP